MVKKIETRPAASEKVKNRRDAGSGKFVARAEKWAAANSTSQEVATTKLKQMGIYDRNGKLAKDYR